MTAVPKATLGLAAFIRLGLLTGVGAWWTARSSIPPAARTAPEERQ